MELAKLKKDIFMAIITSGSAYQKDHWLETAKEAYAFCVTHLLSDKGKTPVKRKKADK